MADGETILTAFAKRLERRFPLTVDDFQAIVALPCSRRDIEPNQYLMREGDRPKFCSFLISGLLFRHKIVADGGRQIVSVHTPGDLVDLQNILLGEADHNVQALTAAGVAQIPHELVMDLAFSHPNIGKALWRESMIEASVFREWVANVGRRDALGLTAVHVNRTLKSLQDEGLIVRSKRSVAISDWERLRVVGDFTSNYLHLGRG
ncbi:MAG: Crp/Fnr family transcriptional regulator [Pseudomonadota bacterium]